MGGPRGPFSKNIQREKKLKKVEPEKVIRARNLQILHVKSYVGDTKCMIRML
jgi:hypothetical protein